MIKLLIPLVCCPVPGKRLTIEELGNPGIFQKFFLTCTSSTVTMVCCLCCELPASRYFSRLGSPAHCRYSCAQLSKGVLHGRFFSPTCFGFCSQEDVSDVYSVIITSFSFIQIMSKQRQDLLSQSQRKLWVFLTGLSSHLSQTASPDLEITGTKAGPGFLDPRAQETPVSTLCSLPSRSKQKVSSDKVWNEERFALL